MVKPARRRDDPMDLPLLPPLDGDEHDAPPAPDPLDVDEGPVSLDDAPADELRDDVLELFEDGGLDDASADIPHSIDDLVVDLDIGSWADNDPIDPADPLDEAEALAPMGIHDAAEGPDEAGWDDLLGPPGALLDDDDPDDVEVATVPEREPEAFRLPRAEHVTLQRVQPSRGDDRAVAPAPRAAQVIRRRELWVTFSAGDRAPCQVSLDAGSTWHAWSLLAGSTAVLPLHADDGAPWICAAVLHPDGDRSVVVLAGVGADGMARHARVIAQFEAPADADESDAARVVQLTTQDPRGLRITVHLGDGARWRIVRT